VIRLAAQPAPDGPAGRFEIELVVSDTGIGISDEGMTRLFDAFSQTDATISRRFGGTGLGLAISRRLACAMGGDITAMSSGVPGEGSVFRLAIPADAATLDDAPAREVLPVELEGKRALVVDDNETNRRILSAQLGRWHVSSVVVASPFEALERVRAGERYDVALLDYLMPEMDGIALAAALKEAHPDPRLPVILHSSVGSLDRGGAPASVDVLITKPIKPSALHDALATALSIQAESSRRRPAAAAGIDPGMAGRLPLRILLAEDNAVNQKLALKLLERHGYQADVVSNGIEAVAATELGAYDVVLMDVQMPELDGLEATRRIRAAAPKGAGPYIVAVTANALADDRAACIAAGMDDYVSKPIRIEALVEALTRAAADGGDA
jgi:CheY-like chemotaxis protein